VVRQRSLVVIAVCVLAWSGSASSARPQGPDAGSPKSATRSRAAAAKPTPLDERPYRIRAWISIAPGARIDQRGRESLIDGWRTLVKNLVGTPWNLEVADGDGPLLAARLEALQPPMAAPLAQGFDKAWMIEIDPLPGSFGLSLSAREYDAATTQIGLVYNEPARSVEDASRALLVLSRDMFSPTAEVGLQSAGGVAIRVQGSSLPAADEVGRVVAPGSVFRAARVYYNPDGSVRRIEPIPRTYLKADSIDAGEVRCSVISRMRDPLTRMVRGKYKMFALGIKPTALHTRLRFVTVPPENRPAAGYTIAARHAPRGPWREVGTTDREGRVVLPPRFVDGLAVVRILAAGIEPLDEIPLMPGELAEERIVTIDPRPDVVTLESRLTAMRDVLVDQAAARARLVALLKPRAQAENWEEVKYLLEEYEKLPKRKGFEDTLNRLEEDARALQAERKIPVLTRSAQNLLRDTNALVERYIDDEEFLAYADAYQRYAATAPAEKSQARTLPRDRPEAALANLAVTSATNANQEESKVGLVEYLPPDLGVRLALPSGASPVDERKELTLLSGLKVEQRSFTLDDAERGRFTLAYFDYQRPPTRESAIKRALDGARALFLSEFRRGRAIAERPITLAGNPGREVEIEAPPDREGGRKSFSRNRAILVGNRLWTISISGTEAMVRARLAELFLDSFRPMLATPPPPISPPDSTPVADATSVGGRRQLRARTRPISRPLGPSARARLSVAPNAAVAPSLASDVLVI
jgi:hypothetical protein